MTKTLTAILLSGALALTLSACESDYTTRQLELSNAHYWQRAEASSAIYQRGPKAQQMLHRDIAQCVTEVRELRRLGGLRTATPANPGQGGTIPDPKTPGGRLAGWDSPERDGYLMTEHTDYHDFETCMMTKGWERVEHVPYDIAEEARDTYVEAITGERRRSENERTTPKPAPAAGPYDGLNQ